MGEDEGVKEDTAEIAEKQKGRQREQYRDRQGTPRWKKDTAVPTKMRDL